MEMFSKKQAVVSPRRLFSSSWLKNYSNEIFFKYRNVQVYSIIVYKAFKEICEKD